MTQAQTKIISFTKDEIKTAVEKHLAAMPHPQGLIGAAATQDRTAQISSIVEGGLCELYRPLRRVIKQAVKESSNWMDDLAFKVIDSVVMAKVCPDVAAEGDAAVETGGKRS